MMMLMMMIRMIMMMMIMVVMVMAMAVMMMVCWTKKDIIIAEASIDLLLVFFSFCSPYTGYGKSSPACTKAGPQPSNTSYHLQ